MISTWEKNELQLLPHIIHKNELEVDRRLYVIGGQQRAQKTFASFLFFPKLLRELGCSKIRSASQFAFSSSNWRHSSSNSLRCFQILFCLLMVPLVLALRVLQFLNFFSGLCLKHLLHLHLPHLGRMSLPSSSMGARGLFRSCPLFSLLSTPTYITTVSFLPL